MAAHDFRERRTLQILRFRECQRRRRQWIGFWDIADWIATERGSVDRRDDGLRQQAYDDLLKAILAGEFEQGSKSLVLHILPHALSAPGSLRLTTERLRAMIDLHDSAVFFEQVLPRSWVPRELARRWFERRQVPWPEFFNPPRSSEGRTVVMRRGRRGPTPGTIDRYGKSDRALFTEIKRIVREDRVSVNEAAARLADKGMIEGTGVSCSRAKRLAERYRRECKN